MTDHRDELRGMTVAVLRGGQSAEREVSRRTGAAVLTALAAAGVRTADLDAGPGLAAALLAARPGAVFIALHGRGGEDGAVQGLLEWLDLPYTGSGVLASALAMDKVRSKQVFVAAGVPTPRWAVCRRAEPAPAAPPFLPAVIKPALEGSSFGMSIVRRAADLPAALALAARYDESILVEEYVPGRELTVSVLGTRAPRALPAVEIIPGNEFFDHEAKYTKGKTEYRVPAALDSAVAAAVDAAALAAYRALGCGGMGRVDIILGPAGPQVLEVNTIPGMTETSLLPKAAAAAGIPFPELLLEILGEALVAYKERKRC